MTDPMKPEEIDYSVRPKTKGGMAHSLEVKEDQWGGKKPPLPRSQLMKKTRSGLALKNELKEFTD